ncbi:MAG: hypothetical protein V1694_08515 [Candidatus Eisenbacteria bacterium]
MKNGKIGIFGRDDDPEVELLKRRVEDLGAKATVIDLCGFPRFTRALIEDERIIFDDLDLTSLDAFYLRQMGYFSPLPEKELNKEEWADYFGKYNDYLANERETRSFTESVIQILCELRPVVNPYRAAFYHKLKAYQYWTLAASGLAVPDFAAGNDFFEIRDFLGRIPSVAKPLTGGFVSKYAPQDLDKDKESLRSHPMLAQRQISGRMLRSFVVAGRLIGTCEIVHAEGDADSRHNILAMKAYTLKPAHQPIPVKACAVLGMVFAGVDLILDEKSDTLYVLECNPAPFFRNFEAQTGLPISQELAHYLVEKAAK